MGALDGKVAVVSGAGQGLGREHALRLAREGAAVVVNDVDASNAAAVVAAVEAAGGRASANVASVSSWAGAQGLIEQAVEGFGDLHIVVNNAGIIRDKMSFSMDEAEWDAVIDVHLKGHFNLSRHAGAWWREQSKAGSETPRRIINTTSEAGLFGSAGQANYAAAKGGIVTLTWVFARELERYGVTTNAIAPRARTAMTAGIDFFKPPEGGGFDKYDPAHVSGVVAWLASDYTADINGQVFIVVGGDVYLVRPFEIINTVKAAEGWTVEGLESVRGSLLAGHKTQPPMTSVGL